MKMPNFMKKLSGFFKKPLPTRQADIYESAGGIQSCCPVCEYGQGRVDPVIAGMSELFAAKCDVCGTEYTSLRISTK